MAKQYSAEIFEQALTLYNSGLTSTEVGRKLGVAPSTVRRWSDRGQQQRRLYSEEDRFDVPPDVLADRERRRTLTHLTYTAAFFGDPLPGMSAWDRR